MVRLNSYILSDDVKDEMKHKLDKTRQDRIELGFTLCTNSNNVIVSRGDHIGNSDKIEINPRACNEDEKFLGGYHTHAKSDSYPGAEDLIHCGIHKIICTGGMDDKIRCNVWKYGQLSLEDKYKMIDEYMSDHKGPKYQQTFDCISNFEPLYREERYIKELDKGLKQLESHLSTPSIRMQYDIAKTGRNLRAGILNLDIKNKSRKYYNEVEIK